MRFFGFFSHLLRNDAMWQTQRIDIVWPIGTWHCCWIYCRWFGWGYNVHPNRLRQIVGL